ncbi:sugar isomerase [Candidatus Azambacteria bacterium RIFCSPHIGHO2_01_FULL_40_24]|uniref:Sugar isomerase n=1 Tax=Candidatus Azambacteria bacterium RIFCSPHIGHO2_01_FULL_40_24 TaxID=1797301 RepID=A0A1F5B3Z4_9BACT|nr:MAG: sugar isomerase [Candidatus Azambacteria bacterium RIFCSPHIGHO2_01_FULL_40_24]
MEKYIAQYLNEAQAILTLLNIYSIKEVIKRLIALKQRRGRIFILGVGGSAGNASHAVNDFRKIAEIEAYAPTDNVSELTARINDEGWEMVFSQWLKVSRLSRNDALLIFSVGGGDEENKISMPLVRAIDYAKEIGATVIGIVGKSSGYTARKADACIVIPMINSWMITVHTESFQALLWHLIVSHPLLKSKEMKWESLGIDHKKNEEN